MLSSSRAAELELGDMKIVLRTFLLASAMPAYLATTACSKPDDNVAYFMSKP